MSDAASIGSALLDIISPDRSRSTVSLHEFPFFIGRGEDTGNHLQLPDQRISRQSVAITLQAGRCYAEDRGHRAGIFVNGNKIIRQVLADGDKLTFGLKDSYEIIFHCTDAETSLQSMLTKIGSISAKEAPSTGLRELNLLL